MKPKLFFVVFVLLSLLIAFIAGGLTVKNNEERIVKDTKTPTVFTNSPLPWPTFTSQKFGFSIKHPLDVTVTEREENVTFFKKGPSQAEATEFYDGISIIVTTGALQGKTIKEIAEGKIKEMQMHAELTKPLSETKIHSLPGYTYTFTGIGSFTDYILPKGKDEYIHITNGTIDPTKQGFDTTATQILSTITIN